MTPIDLLLAYYGQTNGEEVSEEDAALLKYMEMRETASAEEIANSILGPYEAQLARELEEVRKKVFSQLERHNSQSEADAKAFYEKVRAVDLTAPATELRNEMQSKMETLEKNVGKTTEVLNDTLQILKQRTATISSLNADLQKHRTNLEKTPIYPKFSGIASQYAGGVCRTIGNHYNPETFNDAPPQGTKPIPKGGSNYGHPNF